MRHLKADLILPDKPVIVVQSVFSLLEKEGITVTL